MIVTELYKGQGLGNQLWCYVTTRVIALEKGYDFGIKSPEKFKGIEFMGLNFGKQVLGGSGPEGGPPLTLPKGIQHYYIEKSVFHPSGSDVRTLDNDLIHVPDNTKIDGYMQDGGYISKYKNEIRKWLEVKKEYEFYEYSNDNTCIINFRGGTYAKDKDFFLPKSYWENAIKKMRELNRSFRFIVITDDVTEAKKFFPNFDVFHFSISKDYVIIKNAKYLILSNSSFAWFPAWLNEKVKFCIAPKYWARFNTSDGYWSLGYNITAGWSYMGPNGILYDYNTCAKELVEYSNKNSHKYITNTKYDAHKNFNELVPAGTVSPTFKNKIIRKINEFRTQFGTLRKTTSNTYAVRKTIASIYQYIYMRVSNRIKEFLTKKTDIYGFSSSEERKIFELLKNRFNVVFDVGVRTELFYYDIKKDCAYHLFEPNLDFTKILKEKINTFKDHSIQLNEYGLSDKDADNCVYYEKSQSFEINPYLREDSESGKKYYVRTLDGYVKTNKINNIDFLKIDAEGFDYKVLQGGYNTIINENKISFIQFEYWTGVRKFRDLLAPNFDLFLIMEPLLLEEIKKRFSADLIKNANTKFELNDSVIKLNDELVEFIDEKLVPAGLGGNILCINKKIDQSVLHAITFKVVSPSTKTERSRVKNIKEFVIKYQKRLISLTGIPFLTRNIIEYRAKKNWLSAPQIAEYRKKIKIYDVFTFFNELDLLEIRLNILGPYVDYFVIVEATETFSGDKKPLYYQENKDRFKKWHNKIIHHVINDVPRDRDDLRARLYANPHLSTIDKQIIVDTLTADNLGKGELAWFKEFYIKESVKKALVNLRDTDICYISDLDEIWNPELMIDYSKDDIFKPTQLCYMYFLNNRTDEDWTGWSGTIVTKYKNIKNSCLNYFRVHHKMIHKYTFLKNGGWHFTFQGGYEGAKRKIVESNHFWYNPGEVLPNLEKRVLKNIDHKGRNISLWKDDRGLPKYLLINREKYKNLFKE